VGSLFTLLTDNCACIYCASDKYSEIDGSHGKGKRGKNVFDIATFEVLAAVLIIKEIL
jgi:hypothetical protein